MGYLSSSQLEKSGFINIEKKTHLEVSQINKTLVDLKKQNSFAQTN